MITFEEKALLPSFYKFYSNTHGIMIICGDCLSHYMPLNNNQFDNFDFYTPIPLKQKYLYLTCEKCHKSWFEKIEHKQGPEKALIIKLKC